MGKCLCDVATRGLLSKYQGVLELSHALDLQLLEEPEKQALRSCLMLSAVTRWTVQTLGGYENIHTCVCPALIAEPNADTHTVGLHLHLWCPSK